MIRHVVLFKWKPGAGRDEIDAVHEALGRLPSEVSETRRFVFGADARLFDDNYDLAVVADFEDHESYLRYAEHPAHLDFVERVLARVLAHRAAVQFEFTPPPGPPGVEGSRLMGS